MASSAGVINSVFDRKTGQSPRRHRKPFLQVVPNDSDSVFVRDARRSKPRVYGSLRVITCSAMSLAAGVFTYAAARNGDALSMGKYFDVPEAAVCLVYAAAWCLGVKAISGPLGAEFPKTALTLLAALSVALGGGLAEGINDANIRGPYNEQLRLETGKREQTLQNREIVEWQRRLEGQPALSTPRPAD